MADGSTELARMEPAQRANGLVPASLAVELAKADVDQQIATARAYPRDPGRVRDNILSLATLDDETAIECIYALTRGGKAIRGPSIRLAEIIFSQWGNCRAGAQVVSIDRVNKKLTAEGFFHDLETNAATRATVERRISDSKGKIYSDDMIIVTGNAACSIARRNAILAGVPKAVWRKAEQAAERVIAGDVKTLAERRDAALKAFAAFGVNAERLCNALGVSSIEAVTLDHLVTLTGMHTALKNGEETVEALFPVEPKTPPPAPPKPPKAAPKPDPPAEQAPDLLADQDGYIAHLEEQLAGCATAEDLSEAEAANIETIRGRLDRDHRAKAERLLSAAVDRIGKGAA